ncbi:hypothetical protein GmHk_20G058030 [Glycine max]|nr:hypothetical protein GmHk_20G058030 [Glycine max]
MLDQFHPYIQDSIKNIIDVKADGNCGYCAMVALLGMGENLWSLVHNHLHKELFTIDKWMNITNMGYVIASLYNVIVVSLSSQQSFFIRPLSFITICVVEYILSLSSKVVTHPIHR